MIIQRSCSIFDIQVLQHNVLVLFLMFRCYSSTFMAMRFKMRVLYFNKIGKNSRNSTFVLHRGLPVMQFEIQSRTCNKHTWNWTSRIIGIKIDLDYLYRYTQRLQHQIKSPLYHNYDGSSHAHGCTERQQRHRAQGEDFFMENTNATLWTVAEQLLNLANQGDRSKYWKFLPSRGSRIYCRCKA